MAGPGYPLAQGPNDPSTKAQDIFGGPHPGVCLFALADGHVTGLSLNIDVINLGYLANRHDAQPITVDH